MGLGLRGDGYVLQAGGAHVCADVDEQRGPVAGHVAARDAVLEEGVDKHIGACATVGGGAVQELGAAPPVGQRGAEGDELRRLEEGLEQLEERRAEQRVGVVRLLRVGRGSHGHVHHRPTGRLVEGQG